MSLADIVVLFFVMVTLAVVPSASVALVVARSATAGFLNGSAAAAGIVVGDLLFVCLAVLGMAALAEVMGSGFMILRYVAAAYLIWFGFSLLKSKPASQQQPSAHSAATLSASFLSGLLLTLSDVKAILFYASLLPAVVDMSSITPSEISLIVVLTIVAVGGVKLTYAYAASRWLALAGLFKAQRVVHKTVGGVMVGAGLYLLTKP